MASKTPVQGAAGFDVTPTLLSSRKQGLRSVQSPIKKEGEDKVKGKDMDVEEKGVAFEMTPLRRTNNNNNNNNNVVEKEPEEGDETKL
jgi:hypothetical protein